MAKVKRQLKRNTEEGDIATLRAITGNDDIANCGMGIVSGIEEINAQHRRDKEMMNLEAKYRNLAASVYDGTDFQELVDDQKESERKTELSFIKEKFFAFDISGRVVLTTTLKCIIIAIEGGKTFVIGGEDITISHGTLPPDIKLNGSVIIERNGTVAGIAFVGQKGKAVYTFKANKNIWLGQVEAIGSTPATLDL